MNEEDFYMLGCLTAVKRMIENGSTEYTINLKDKSKTVTWVDVKEWLEKRYTIEPRQTDSD